MYVYYIYIYSKHIYISYTTGLQARGGRGEHSPPGPNGEFDISNKGDYYDAFVSLL